MPNTREKLVELLAEHCAFKGKRCVGCDEGKYYQPECKTNLFGKIADHLIANGVTVFPCKVGDRLYTVFCRGIGDWFIQESVVSRVEINEDFGMEIIERRKGIFGEYFHYKIDLNQIGKSIFLTKEEAEAHLPQPPKGE